MKNACRWFVPSSILGLVLLALGASSAGAQEAAEIFRQSCISCHTIGGGRLVGPDLKDVEERKDREWLADFILDPMGVLASGDAYALQLREEAGGAVMTAVPGMSHTQAEALLDLIAAESLLEASQFAGLDLGDEPFTALDIERGEEIFMGHRKLVNGGPACLACHTVGGLPQLSGGTLGPDLSRVFERLQGRKNLASWLLAPATETMRPVFAGRAMTQDEIVPLVAFFEDSARQRSEDGGTSQLLFLILGLAGAALGFLLADGLWRRRFRGVRRELVRGRR
ncbi:MAG: c-type cytochrome [Deltaproteobacteria bacterium]|nr:c-type cytochrome [Deltaproteobacteria bacterium]